MRTAVRVMLVLVVLLAACASGLDGARQALATGARVQIGLWRLLSTADVARQTYIAKTAIAQGHPEQARPLLAEHKQKRELAAQALDHAAELTEDVAELIDRVDKGNARRAELDAKLAELTKASAEAARAVTNVGDTPPTEVP